MEVVGRAALILALGLALYGAAASIYGVRAVRRDLIDSGRRALYGMAAMSLLAFGALEYSFLADDFSLDVVASHSSTTTDTFYKATAVWSSQEGSLLLWLTLLGVWSSVALLVTRRHLREIAPYATAVLCGFGAFFAFLLVFRETPFATSPAPAEGAGLNPLLRHPAMMIHPPMLYSGYTLFAVPFAFAIGALVTRRVGHEWIAATRRFSLMAWLALGFGIMLGARWSYSELGWGGYWAWDPVENASLLPWLTGTAFIHSVMIQERRGMLKTWNVSLILATGTLAVLGTFLVRSGILDSIHAFGASTLGTPFLILIATMIAGSVALVLSRREELKSEHRLDSLLSREAVFLLNNLVLVALAIVVFWGTFFPLISEAVTGNEASVGPPWFDRYVVPLSLTLVLLSGIGPVIAWRKAGWKSLRRAFAFPVAVAVAVVPLSLALGAEGRPYALTMFAFGAFVAAVVTQELWRGTRARRAMAGEAPPRALVALVGRNRRRYGGYVVHLGIAILFVGVAASSAFQDAKDVRLTPGQSTEIDGYTVRYVKPEVKLNEEKITLGAEIVVEQGGRRRVLHPSRGYYPSRDPSLGSISRFLEGEATSEIGLDAGFTRDVWTAIQPDLEPLRELIEEADRRFPDADAAVLGPILVALTERYRDQPPPATFRLIVSPLVSWIWIGGIVLLLGALLAMWPGGGSGPSRSRAKGLARVAREVGRVPTRA